MRFGKTLTEGNIYRNYLLYALPLIGSSILSQLYSTVDAIIAGKYIGDLALGAVSATGSVEGVLFTFFGGFAGGFSIYLSNLFGQRNYTKIRRDTYATVLFIGGIGLLVGLLAVLFRNPILDYLKVDDVLRRDTEIYFVIILLGGVFTYTNQILAQVLPAMGITSHTIFVSLGSAILNLGGNLLTVTVFDMGVAGLALSTVFSTACVTVIYGFLLHRAFRKASCEKTPFCFRFSDVTQSFQYTIPVAAQQLAFHGVGLLIAPSINGLGAAASAGYNVSTRLYSLSTMTLWNVTSAVACYAAQCVGEGKFQKIPRGLRAGFLLNGLMLFPVTLLFVLFAEPIVSIFFPAEFEGLAFEYALRYVQIYLPFIFIQMVDHLLHAQMRSLGGTNAVFIISLLGSAVRFTTTLWLTPSMQMDGVYLSQVISWGADALITLCLYLYRYRTPEQIQRNVQKKFLKA